MIWTDMSYNKIIDNSENEYDITILELNDDINYYSLEEYEEYKYNNN